jgi:transcriptional regulator with XRE-family HTH domain
MARHTDIEVEMGERLRLWLEHFRAKYAAIYPAQDDLARKLGVAGPNLSQWLNRHRLPGIDLLVRLNRAFTVDANALINDDPPPIESESRPRYASSTTAATGRRKTAARE